MGGILYDDDDYASSSDEGGPHIAVPDDTGSLLKAWKATFAAKTTAAPFNKADLTTFFNRALQIITSSEENMENAITALATQGGLTRLRQLINRDFDIYVGDRLSSIWRDALVVCFKILGHDTVLQSETVDRRRGILMDDLFKHDAKFSSSLFRAAERSLVADNQQGDAEICIAVLCCMLTHRSTRSDFNVAPQLRAAAESMIARLADPHQERVLSIRKALSHAQTARPSAIKAPQVAEAQATVRSMQADFKLRKPTAKSKARPTAAPVAPSLSQANATPSTTGNRLNFSRHDNDHKNISEIEILPTLREIMCDQNPYLPPENPALWHKSGMDGVLDRHFRLVREDTVGQMRIALKAPLKALQNPSRPASTHILSQGDGAKSNVYQHVDLYDVRFDANKGIQFILKVKQPEAVTRLRDLQAREHWWRQQQRLDRGTLMCLLSSNGSPCFLVVHDPPPPRPGRQQDPYALHIKFTRGMDKAHAFVIAELASTNPDDALGVLGLLGGKNARCLVEFPGQILPSFAPTLAALKVMSTKTGTIPFATALTPDATNFQPSAPRYSLARGFRYDLSSLARQGGGAQPLTMVAALKNSVLDDRQQEAVEHALTNELALIQGPPGTGKSFTGVKIIQALLDNRQSGNLGPILCVCYTNHALDQLLEHLLDVGVTGIVRMGGGSKSERLESCKIKEVSKRYNGDGNNRAGGQIGRAKKRAKNATKNMYGMLDDWKRRNTIHDVEGLYMELGLELQEFFDSKSAQDDGFGQKDLPALSAANIIGMTTSGLAMKHQSLRKLRAKVVVVEEAGEVLEAHLLTAMLPFVEHAILIGDHQQLRPKVNNYDLSKDNPCSRITLDESMFERLVSPRYDLSPGLPFVTLEMQRRMHPSISNLIRSTLYPNLGDGGKVKSYPEVAGMARRLFWHDHRNNEDMKTPGSDSQSNRWEVKMVVKLVGHLQKQGKYSAGEIAVLTPYSGQVKALQKELGASFGIILSELDTTAAGGIRPESGKTNMINAIRLSTVDAFQGEEAKVVIISLVRSNDKQMCGFLNTTNRINVLLSRAKHGMYIIGDSRVTAEVPMWQQILEILRSEGNFGDELELLDRRSKGSVFVREPGDFARIL